MTMGLTALARDDRPLRPLLTHALLVGLVTPALLVGFARPTSAASVDGERAQLPTRRAVAEGTPARAMAARINAMMTRADTVPVRADTVREYRGVYETGFEVSWFH